MADEDWLAGASCGITAWRATASRSAPAPVPVTLSVADARGKAARKKVVYLVGTDPTPTVIRHDGP